MKLFIIALMVLAISAHSTYEDPPDMDLLQQEDWNQQYNPGAVDKAAVAGEALSDLVDQDVYSYDTVKKMTRAEHEIAAGMLTEVVKEKKAAEVEKHSVEHPQQVAALMLGERISDEAFVHEADQPRSDESPEEAAAIAKRIVEEAPKDVEGLEDGLEESRAPAPKSCGGAGKCTDRYKHKYTWYVKQKVMNTPAGWCTYHKSFGRCKHSYYKRICALTCTGKGKDTQRIHGRRKFFMGNVPVREVYKDKCAMWAKRSRRSCRAGTWLSRRCPKTCHGKGKAGKDENGKEFVYYASKIKKRIPYCQYRKEKGQCKAGKNDRNGHQYRWNLNYCQKTCSLCNVDSCVDRYAQKPYKRNTYEYKTYKNRCEWAKENKYCKSSKWYRSNHYQLRCKKTCTGSGKDTYRNNRSFRTIVRVRKEWSSRCAYFKSHHSNGYGSNCKSSSWVKRNCPKTCTGKGKDKWVRPYRSNRAKIKSTKTYNGYCGWRKARGDCDKAAKSRGYSWLKRSCIKTCGFCKAKTPCKKEKKVKKKRSTVTNLMNFKAFCMGAKEKADDVLDSWDGGKGGSMSALLPFIIAYGKPSKHPFIDYAKQIAKYKAKYPMGISRYVITNLHNSIVNGAGVVDVNKPVGFCSLRHQAFGLTARPYMLRKVLTTLTKFSELKQKAQKALSGADAKAAAAWLKSGAKTKFKTFKARVEDYYKAKVHECYRKTIKIGVNAEFKAFEKMKRLDAKALFKQVRAQVPAGLKATAARRNCKFLLPNGRQIQALTKAKAAHWLKTKQFSMKNAKDVIKAFMKQRAAIHIKILTGKAKNAQSDMVPTAVIKGSDRTKTVKLKIKKTPGKWGTALVMAQGLGDFKKLTLKAGNMDGWLIQEVRVAQGKGRWLGMLAQSQRGFDLDSTSSSKWLDMKPFNKPAHYGLKKITGKKVSTMWSYVPNGKSFGSKGSLSPGKLDSQGRCDCTMKGLRSKGAACKCRKA